MSERRGVILEAGAGMLLGCWKIVASNLEAYAL